MEKKHKCFLDMIHLFKLITFIEVIVRIIELFSIIAV